MEEDEIEIIDLEAENLRLKLIIKDLQHKNDFLYEELLKYQLLHQGGEEKSVTIMDTSHQNLLESSNETCCTSRSSWFSAKNVHEIITINSLEKEVIKKELVVMKMNVDHLLIPKMDIQLKERVGKGSFGEVW